MWVILSTVAGEGEFRSPVCADERSPAFASLGQGASLGGRLIPLKAGTL